MRFVQLVLPLLLAASCTGYRILGIFPLHAKSHFVMFEQLMKGLARRGHQVDVISTYPLKKPHPNYKDLVVLKPPYEVVNNFTYNEVRGAFVSMVLVAVAGIGGKDVCRQLEHPDILKIIRDPPKDPPYDAVILEIFGAHCFAIIGHLLKVPLIGASSSALYPWANSMIANPQNLAFLPNNLLPFTNNMGFFDRLYNVVHTAFSNVYFDYVTGSSQDEIIARILGEGMPTVRELERSFSMILANSHMSLTGIKPTTPALVEVGGIHVQEEDIELPITLEKWMNESTHGFVYFSFGSMLKIESFPEKYLNIFYKSLGKLAPIRVLMKVPNPSELPPGLPKNIHTLPWMPQVKILKHRNIKAFITHGGLMGTQEAIHYGVPLVGIPLFADQFTNIDVYVHKNIAVKLHLATLTEEKMDEALNAVLTNPIYRDTMKKVSARFLDRPMSAVDTSNYWVEYVIRNGPDSLRSPAMDLAWWQIALLDVYVFLLAVALILALIIVRLLKFAMNLVRAKGETSAVPRAKKVN